MYRALQAFVVFFFYGLVSAYEFGETCQGRHRPGYTDAQLQGKWVYDTAESAGTRQNCRNGIDVGEQIQICQFSF